MSSDSSAKTWCTRLIPGVDCEIGIPSISARPVVGACSPARTFSNVVLPDPDGPTTAVRLPGANTTLSSTQHVDAAKSGR